MATASLFVSIIAVLLALASAYAAWRSVLPKPKLSGRIMQAWPFGPAGTNILVHIFVTNASSHPVHLMDYRLEARINDGWVDADGLQDKEFTMPPLIIEDNHEVTLKPQNLLHWPPKCVEHGAPLMGFLAFVLPNHVAHQPISGYRLTVTDVFGQHEELSTSVDANRIPFNVLDLFRHSGAQVEPIADSDASLHDG